MKPTKGLHLLPFLEEEITHPPLDLSTPLNILLFLSPQRPHKIAQTPTSHKKKNNSRMLLKINTQKKGPQGNFSGMCLCVCQWSFEDFQTVLQLV